MRPLFWIRLSVRLARDARKWWAAVVFGVAVMAVTTTYLVFQSLAVSDQQLLDRDLGRYSATIGFGTQDVQPGSDWPALMVDALRARGFTDFFVSLSIMDVPEGPVREGNWADEPFPGRFVLQQGEWADQPGEVVVALRDPNRAQDVGERLELLSGRVRLVVVGVATDAFGGNRTSYLIGNGTWAQVPPSTAMRFPQVAAHPMVYWDGSRQSAMLKAFIAGHPASADLRTQIVRESMISRSLLLERNRGQGAGQDNVFAYALPSIGVPLLGALVWVGLLRRRLLRHRRQLSDLGIGPRMAALVPAGAALAPLVLAMIVGVGAGIAVTAAARPWVASWHDQPLSPLVLPWDPLLRSALVLSVTALTTVIWLVLGRRATSPGRTRAHRERQPEQSRRWTRELRRWIAVLTFVGAIAILPTASSGAVAMWLAAACVVLGTALAPDVLAAVTRMLPSDDFRLRMATRQLQTSSPSSAGTAVMAACIGSAIAFTILLSSLIATMDGRQTPDVLPGQVIINSRETAMHRPAAPEALRIVESLDLDYTHAVQLRFTYPDNPNDLKRTIAVQGSQEAVMAVDTAEQAEALLGEDWEDQFDSVLRSGGMVRWFNGEEGEEEATGEAEVVLTYAAGQQTPLARIEAFNTDWPRVNWARGVAGITLSSTLRSHEIPLNDGEVILTGASNTVATEIRTALARQGLDQDLVLGYREPPPPIPPAGLVATAALLAVIALLMITTSAAGRVAELRPTLGVLLANGVPPSWIRQCVLFQESIILAVGVGVGAIFGTIPILASVPRFSGYWTVSLPWGQMAVLLLACVLGSGAAALLSAWRLQPELRDSPWDPTT